MRLYGIRTVIYFCDVFQLLFSGVALLNWFTKSSNFKEGFNDNELS